MEYTPQQLEKMREEHREALKKDPKSMDVRIEMLCADVLLCEAYEREQGQQWRNYALCEEIRENILPLIHNDEQHELGISICQRAADTLYQHPRLKHRLLKYALDTRISYGMEPDFDLEHEVIDLCKNILNADMGNFEKIKNDGHLKHDPVEWTEPYEKAIHLAEEKAEAELADHPRGMGFCFAYWPTLKRILKKDYGIDWRTPAEMNPRVIFD